MSAPIGASMRWLTVVAGAVFALAAAGAQSSDTPRSDRPATDAPKAASPGTDAPQTPAPDAEPAVIAATPPAEAVLPLRHTAPAEVAALMRSAAELWGLEAAVEVDEMTRAVRVRAASEKTISELYRLLVVLDRDVATDLTRTAPARGEPGERVDILGDGKLAKTRVDILAGEVPVREFLAFLAERSGAPVIVEGDTSRSLDTKIAVVADVHDADDDFVRALLAANGWIVEEVTVRGRQILQVYHATTAPSGIPTPRKIIRIDR